MWTEIKDKIIHNGILRIPAFKRQFCVQHDVNWSYDCLLCERYDCSRYKHSSKPTCPLGTCKETYSVYQVACDRSTPLEIRQSACDRIIEVIRGIPE